MQGLEAITPGSGEQALCEGRNSYCAEISGDPGLGGTKATGWDIRTAEY